MRITLDTNILISATFWTGDSFKVLDLIDKKKLTCVISKEILSEYTEVIQREELLTKIKDKHLIISNVSKKVLEKSTIVEPKMKIDAVEEDTDDNKILECALEGGADFIVTNDAYSFYEN